MRILSLATLLHLALLSVAFARHPWTGSGCACTLLPDPAVMASSLSLCGAFGPGPAAVLATEFWRART